MLDIMSLQILRDIAEKINSNLINSILVDETSDVWNREELILALNGSVNVYIQAN